MKQGKTIIQLIRFCENMDLDHHQRMNDVMCRKKKFLNYSEEDLKKPPIENDEVKKITLKN